MRTRTVLLLAVLAASAAASRASAEETSIRVIVHPSNGSQAFTRRELSDLFLKKTTRWPDGAAVVPVEPPERSITRLHFLSGVMGRTAFALKVFWKRRVADGRDVPPVERPSDVDVVAFVRETPGAIGYVSPETDVTGVKVLPISD
jgi:ABC-type phosphate transport system substrate-binding protein